MTKEKIEIIKKLNEFKLKIEESKDSESMSYLAKAVIKLIKESTIEIYDKKGLSLIMNSFENESERVLDENHTDLNTGKFQLSTSLIQIMISFTGAGIEELKRILKY